MSRQRIAGLLLVISSLALFAGQFIALLLWDAGVYSLQFHLISDLGMTTCNPMADRYVPRYVCSPGHVWFNVGAVISGLALLAGGLLLRRVAGYALAVSGVALALVGVFPYDRNTSAHDAAAVLQALATWIAMIAVAAAARETSRVLAGTTIALLVVSVIGFGLLVFLPQGAPGLYERLSFDLLTVWTLLLGVVLTQQGRPPRPRTADAAQAERDAAVRKAARELE